MEKTVSTHRRHVPYCQRRQERLPKRGKSCQGCKYAKTKCNFATQCTRCVKKGIECTYDWIGVTSSTNFVTMHSRSIEEKDSTDVTTSKSLPETPDPQTTQLSLTTIRLVDNETVRRYLREQVSWTRYSGALRWLVMPDDLAQTSSSIIIQALQSIPTAMLSRETLPPFIHPQHSLPESLAICMKLSHDFVTRTPQLTGLLWRTIRSEQLRAISAVSNLLQIALNRCLALIDINV